MEPILQLPTMQKQGKRAFNIYSFLTTEVFMELVSNVSLTSQCP